MYYTRIRVDAIRRSAPGDRRKVKRVQIDGRWLTVAVEPNGEAVILSSQSGDPRDYLDPRFKPGRRVRVPA